MTPKATAEFTYYCVKRDSRRWWAASGGWPALPLRAACKKNLRPTCRVLRARRTFTAHEDAALGRQEEGQGGDDQVLVPRASLKNDTTRIVQYEIQAAPREAEAILQKQHGLLWYDATTKVQSYFPQSEFVKNEATPRQLLFPNARPSDADCARSQPTRRIDPATRKRPHYTHSSSESEIDWTNAGEPVTRGSPNAKKKKSGKRPGR